MSQNIVETPADESILLITRSFAAPRTLIYRCYTDPQHLARFWGPRNARTRATITALEPGGVWETHWTYDDGGQYSYTSVYIVLKPVEEITYRDAPNGWPGGLEGLPPVSLQTTMLLTEADAETTVKVLVRCTSVAARDQIVKQGFAGMVATGHDRLAEYLQTIERLDN
jgi:uncharacterized protein YndB with AHSA1/START domain